MAEPIITTGALIAGTTKAAIAMVPAIAISMTAAYGTFRVIEVIERKLHERKMAKHLKRRGIQPTEGLNRYQLYLAEKQRGLEPGEAFKLATEKLESAREATAFVMDMMKTNVNVTVPSF